MGLRPFYSKEDKKAATVAMQLLGMETLRKKCYRNLSGGQQQRVLLARALCATTKVLILDEPTRGIDIGTKVEIQKLVLKLAAEGMSITFISSEIEEMLRTCSRLIVMKDLYMVGELTGEDMTQDQIMYTIAGGGDANVKK